MLKKTGKVLLVEFAVGSLLWIVDDKLESCCDNSSQANGNGQTTFCLDIMQTTHNGSGARNGRSVGHFDCSLKKSAIKDNFFSISDYVIVKLCKGLVAAQENERRFKIKHKLLVVSVQY